MGLNKKQIIGSLLGVFSIGLISLVISMPKSQQKQNPPPQGLTQTNPAAVAEPEENPRIKEIIQLADEKRSAYILDARKLEEFSKATNILCASHSAPDCEELKKQLANDPEVTNALTKIYNGGIHIFIRATRKINQIYIDNSGALIISESTTLNEIRKFLGLKPKK